MKMYHITEADLERLLLRIDRNPDHGKEGGSSGSDEAAQNSVEAEAHRKAYRFYNYQVRQWIHEVKQ